MFNKVFQNADRWQKVVSRMDRFYPGLKIPCQQINGGDEAVPRQFVRLAGTSGPVLSLACLTLLSFVWAFYFSVRVFVSPFFFFLAGRGSKGILSESDWRRKRGKGQRVLENLLMWWWSDHKPIWQGYKPEAEPTVSAPFSWFILPTCVLLWSAVIIQMREEQTF